MRTAATVAVMAGLLVAAGGIQGTSASWEDAVNFAIQASTATTTTTTTTTAVPLGEASVAVTAICSGPTSWTLRVVHEDGPGPLQFDLQSGGWVISGPHTIGIDAELSFEVPAGVDGVWAVPVGDWINTSGTTASTPTTLCEQPPPPLPGDPEVSITAICRSADSYTVEVAIDVGGESLEFELRRGNLVISGPHTIEPGETKRYEIPGGLNGVKVNPIGDWRNGWRKPVTEPKQTCPPDPATADTSQSPQSPQVSQVSQAPRGVSVTSGGISAANASTVISDIAWNIATPRVVCATVSVTGATTTKRDWAIRVNLATAPWYGSAPGRIDVDGTGVVGSESPSSILITGRSGNGRFDPRSNNTPISNKETALVSICNDDAPVPPPADLSWYSTTQVPSGEWSAVRACVALTVTVARSSPFFSGWVAPLDLTAAKASIVDSGGTPGYVDWSPSPTGADDFEVSPPTFDPPPDSFLVISGDGLALRSSDAPSQSVTACVHAAP